jgi:hypothetical protein
MNIQLRIDRIVIDGAGVAAHRSGEVGEAIRAELVRLIATTPPSVWRQSRHQYVVRQSIRQEVTPDRLGLAAARALHTALIDGETRR